MTLILLNSDEGVRSYRLQKIPVPSAFSYFCCCCKYCVEKQFLSIRIKTQRLHFPDPGLIPSETGLPSSGFRLRFYRFRWAPIYCVEAHVLARMELAPAPPHPAPASRISSKNSCKEYEYPFFPRKGPACFFIQCRLLLFFWSCHPPTFPFVIAK